MEQAASDAEARLTGEDHLALRVWLRLLTASNLIQSAVRSRLQGGFGITLARFDFLAQLERVPDGLSMSELSRRLMVTGGSVTGIADGLEAEGLIARAPDPRDGRVLIVRPTREGQRAFARMAKEHEQWIVGMFDDLPARDQKQLLDLLGKLKKSVIRETATEAT